MTKDEREAVLEDAARVADDWAAAYPTGGTPIEAKAAGHGRTVARGIAAEIRALLDAPEGHDE